MSGIEELQAEVVQVIAGIKFGIFPRQTLRQNAMPDMASIIRC